MHWIEQIILAEDNAEKHKKKIDKMIKEAEKGEAAT